MAKMSPRRYSPTLELDLIGPRAGIPEHQAHLDELLPERPTSWYLTGFLVPFEASAEARAGDDIGDETEVEGERGGDDDQQSLCSALAGPSLAKVGPRDLVARPST